MHAKQEIQWSQSALLSCIHMYRYMCSFGQGLALLDLITILCYYVAKTISK